MTDDRDPGEQQQRADDEQQQLTDDIRAALCHATDLGLPPDEVNLLAWAAGIPLTTRKEQRA